VGWTLLNLAIGCLFYEVKDGNCTNERKFKFVLPDESGNMIFLFIVILF